MFCEKSIYLVYANEKASISADVIGTKQASAATTKRDFEVEIVTIYTVVLKLMPSGHISHIDILDIFNPNVVSTSTLERGVNQLTDQCDTYFDTVLLDAAVKVKVVRLP